MRKKSSLGNQNKFRQCKQFIKRVVKSNYFNENKYTKILEKFSHLLRVKYVVATTSGTISILALKASGIKYGDQVIIPNITFPATVNAVADWLVLSVIVDVDKKSLIDTKKLERKLIIRPKQLFQCIFQEEETILNQF